METGGDLLINYLLENLLISCTVGEMTEVTLELFNYRGNGIINLFAASRYAIFPTQTKPS